MIRLVLRWVLRIGLVLLAGLAVYVGVTAVQVFWTSVQYDPQDASAAIVMGAAQYDGVPSPDLRARLDEARTLWRKRYTSLIVVTGGRATGRRLHRIPGRCPVSRVPGSSRLGHRRGRRQRQLGQRGRRGARDAGSPRVDAPRGDRPLPRGPQHGHRLGAGVSPLPDADAALADPGLVRGALLRQGDGGRRSREGHRLSEPRLPALWDPVGRRGSTSPTKASPVVSAARACANLPVTRSGVV